MFIEVQVEKLLAGTGRFAKLKPGQLEGLAGIGPCITNNLARGPQ